MRKKRQFEILFGIRRSHAAKVVRRKEERHSLQRGRITEDDGWKESENVRHNVVRF